MSSSSDKKNLIGLFVYVSIAISIGVFIVSVTMIIDSVVDYFIFSDLTNWYDYRYGVLQHLPNKISFFVVSFICLCLLSRKAHAFSLVSAEGVWGILSKVIVLCIIITGALLTLVPMGFVFSEVLKGDISLNSFVSFALIMAFGSIIFYYYRGVLNDRWGENIKHANIFATISLFLAVILLAFSVYVINPLNRIELIKTYDTLSKLASVTEGVDIFYEKNKILPVSIESIDVSDSSDYNSIKHISIKRTDDYISDRYIGVTYSHIGTKGFKVCGTFNELPQKINLKNYPYIKFPVTEIGENCFEFSVKQ